MKRIILALSLFASAGALAAVSDFTRTVISTKLNGHEGVQFIKWEKGSGGTAGRGWAVRFDLSKGYRLRTQFGDAKRNKATVGTMAETVFADEGVAPIMGVNGDYFDTGVSYARCTGLVITDDELVTRGFTNSSAAAMCYMMQTADGNLVHSAMTRHAATPTGCPTAAWQLSAGGKKIRQAIRTNYCNYPVKAGKINPVGGSSGGATFPTTIGNMQSRTNYPRPLIGIGTNAVGVATNLVLFVNDGRQNGWSAHFPDVDAYQIMINEGCNEVGEFDGGGSAAMWMEFGRDSEFNFGTSYATEHGNYVNKPSDGSPRRDACGIFVLPPKAVTYTVEVNDGSLYENLTDAFKVVAPGDAIKVKAATTLTQGDVFRWDCAISSVDPATAKVSYTGSTALTVPDGVKVAFKDVAFVTGKEPCAIAVAAGGVATVAGRVDVKKFATATAAGFVLAGALTADVVVDCAAAGSAGSAFGSTTLAGSALESSLAHLHHPSNPALVAKADGATLVWKVGVTFGGIAETEGYNYTNRAVSVNVSKIDGTFTDGAKLRLTISDVSGTAVATLDRDLKGTGDYSFDTVEDRDAKIVPGMNYVYRVSLVDGQGRAIAGADSVGGTFLTATDANWFSTLAADDSATGGAWKVKPTIKDKMFTLVTGTTYSFEPTVAKDGIARVTTEAHFGGGYTADTLGRLAESYASNPPKSVLTMMEQDDGELVWAGLIREGDKLVFKKLFGIAARDEHTYRCVQEVDSSTGRQLVSYLIAEGAGEPVRLADADGRVWFVGPNADGEVVSRVELEGAAKVRGIVGEFADKSILTVNGKVVTLLTNVVLDPATLASGEYVLDRGGKGFRWIDNGRGVAYDPATGKLKVLGGAPKNGYPSYLSYLLNFDAEDPDSKPVATFFTDERTGALRVKLMLANGKEFKPRDRAETGVSVKVSLESAQTLDFAGSTQGARIPAAEFAPVIDTTKGAQGFYKCRLFVEE